MIRTLRTAWRACPLAFAIDAAVSVVALIIAGYAAWNLTAGHFLAAGVGAAALAIGVLGLRNRIRIWKNAPVALRAELLGSMKAMRAAKMWVYRSAARSEEVLLRAGFVRSGVILFIQDEAEPDGAALAVSFLMPRGDPKVYRYVSDAQLSRRDLRGDARLVGRAMREGLMDASPEEIRAAIRQVEGAEPLPAGQS
jgi:hypothetical protein